MNVLQVKGREGFSTSHQCRGRGFGKEGFLGWRVGWKEGGEKGAGGVEGRWGSWVEGSRGECLRIVHNNLFRDFR